ncbi:hypothetical protein ABZY09_20660 [Streptomyces sp. NPDC002928]|uniref:hypothetical protein n=1 Tax=Streptomyces sp. NPDC002928 TaxID=3154440 RepID=UPI0033B2DFD1
MGDVYCGGWRSSPAGSNLEARSCVQVDTGDFGATFGVEVRNVGKSQVTVAALVKYVADQTTNCPDWSDPLRGIRIDPGGHWYSPLGQCSVSGLEGKQFQAAAYAVEDPNGATDPKLGGVKYSINVRLWTDGQVTCRYEDGSQGSCDPWKYVPGS